MAYFGRQLKEFSGYWILQVSHNEELTEEEVMASLQWYTHSGNKLSWVEAWYAVPEYNKAAQAVQQET